MQRDDAPTVAAVAILAGCVATIAHEAVGHGAACLAFDGEITRLTSVYFTCSAQSWWIAAGGPIGNMGAALLGGLGLAALPAAWMRARLFALLLMAISLFWIGGYGLYAAVLGEGDPWWVLMGLSGGEPGMAARVGMAALGVATYAVAIALVRRAGQPLPRLRLSWLAASLAALAAALTYAPDRLASGVQGMLEIGGACIPLLFPGAAAPGNDAPIRRSWRWIIASVLGLGLFIVTLGRGLPWV